MNAHHRYIDSPVYRTSKIKHYQGNPLIEALPEIMSREEAAENLAWLPDLPTQEERELPGYLRLHYIATIRKIAIPLPDYLAFEPMIAMMLRTGYVDRNPVKSETWKKIYEMNLQRSTKVPLPSPAESAHSLLFSGISGTGKTTFINRVLSTLPQVVQHSCYKDESLRIRQLVWLKVDCPADGTPKSMSTNFLVAVDRVLGTTYAEAAKSGQINAAGLLAHMQGIAQNNFLGVLILDELHHLRGAKSGNDKLLDALAALFNAIEVPIIGIGTPDVTTLFSKKLANVRRAASNGAYEFRLPTGPTDEAWVYFLNQLWAYQWLKKPAKLTPKLNKAFFDHSHGITFFAAAMFMLCQYRLVMDEEDEKITVGLLDDIAANELAPLQPALRVLRSGQNDQMRCFEDLLPDEGWFNNLLSPEEAVRNNPTQRKVPKKRPSAKEKERVKREREEKELQAKENPNDMRNHAGQNAGHSALKDAGHIPSNLLNFGEYK